MFCIVCILMYESMIHFACDHCSVSIEKSLMKSDAFRFGKKKNVKQFVRSNKVIHFVYVMWNLSNVKCVLLWQNIPC
jgi:hypothetical protein